ERDRARDVGDVDRDVVEARRCHRIGHGSEPTTWRTMPATAAAAAAPTPVMAPMAPVAGVPAAMPAAGLVTRARPRTSAPAWRAAIVSSAMDMPTTSAP